jgi:hypothetical protein
VLPASSMADAAFGNVVQQDGGAVLRIGQALYGLVGSLISSLGELRDVGNMLEQEIAAGVVTGSPDELQGSVSVDVRPQLLLVVAGVLKEMVGTLVSDIKGNAEVQKLLPAIQKCRGANQHDIFQDLAISKQSLTSCLLDLSPPRRELPVPTSRNGFTTGKKSVVKGQLVCRHACAQHPEVVDPGVWRNLPQELVGRVFGKLPLPTILQFRKSCLDWSGLVQSSNIKEGCAEGHPKLFGLVVYRPRTMPYIYIHDIKSEEWLRFELVLPSSHDAGAYAEFLYSCDGGLACMVPLRRSTSLLF